MKNAHIYVILLFVFVLAYDCVVWGAAAHLPDDVGKHIFGSARKEAPLVYAYMSAGDVLDNAVPALDAWGQRHATAALSDGFGRIKDDPTIAMDLIFSDTWNSRHALLKFLFWAAPVLFVLAIIFWLRRPKKVSLMGGRRR